MSDQQEKTRCRSCELIQWRDRENCRRCGTTLPEPIVRIVERVVERVVVRQDRCPDLVIGCVDTRAARRVIECSFSRALNRVSYWLDLGNNAASGQYILGQPLNVRNRRKTERLRTASELYPEITDENAGEDPLPSCSAVEALDRQEPFINQTLAASALAMLAQLFRYGKIGYHGAFFNAKSGYISPVPVDPALWCKVRRRTREKHNGK